MFLLTEHGKKCVEDYIAELKAKRKEILDAGKDSADDPLPTADDILSDVNDLGVDDDGEYYNGWAVTNNYDADYPLLLKVGRDLAYSDDSFEDCQLEEIRKGYNSGIDVSSYANPELNCYQMEENREKLGGIEKCK